MTDEPQETADLGTVEETLWDRVWKIRREQMAPESVFAVDPWRIVEKRWDPRYLAQTETLFAMSNGFLGVRGNFEEMRPAYSRVTLINGFHETWPIVYGEEAFGFAKTGQTIVPVPDATLINLYVDDEPFEVPRADILEWRRSFCMETGSLYRDVTWQMPTGKRLRLSSRRFVSYEHRHLLLIDYEVRVLDEPALLTISSELTTHRSDEGAADPDDPRRARVFDGDSFDLVGSEVGDERVQIALRTKRSGMTVSAAMHHQIETECECDRSLTLDHDHARLVLRVNAHPDHPLRLTKYVAYHNSERTGPEELMFRGNLTLDRSLQIGRDEIARQQEQRAKEFWDSTDVEVEDDPALQQAIRFNLFQVFQASTRADNHGVPAKGLTGTGYEGHYFWDTEIYVMPMLTYTNPQAAENLLRFRAGMLDSARKRAREVGHAGALYPWRTINGDEASAYYAAGTAQYHINADIVFGLIRYIRATGDLDLLTQHGAELLVETARLYRDLGFFNERRDDKFCINGVTGPDEYTTVVNNNLYTNLMAAFNLLGAADLSLWLRERHPDDFDVVRHRTKLRDDEIDEWRRAGSEIYIPYDAEAHVHLQDDDFLDREVWDFAGTPPENYPLLLHYHPLEIYRHQVIKQADVVLATFMLGWNFTYEEKRRVFEYYDPLTTGDSSLSASIQSVMAAELGRMEKACEYFADAVLVDLTDAAGNVRDGLHIASAGGVWLALVFGFAGLRDHWGELHFQPAIPDGWSRLRFRLRRRQSTITVDITPEEATYSVVGPQTAIYHWDERVILKPDEPVSMPNPSRDEMPEPASDTIEAPPVLGL